MIKCRYSVNDKQGAAYGRSKAKAWMMAVKQIELQVKHEQRDGRK